MTFLGNHWGDLCSALGMLIAIVGFGISIWQIRKTKTVAESARESAEQTRLRLDKNLAIADISAAIEVMEEIKRSQRRQDWNVALDRYGHLNRLLVKVRNEYPNLSDKAKTHLQSAINHTSINEGTIEKALANEQPALDVARLNEVVSHQLVELGDVEVEIRART